MEGRDAGRGAVEIGVDREEGVVPGHQHVRGPWTLSFGFLEAAGRWALAHGSRPVSREAGALHTPQRPQEAREASEGSTVRARPSL